MTDRWELRALAADRLELITLAADRLKLMTRPDRPPQEGLPAADRLVQLVRPRRSLLLESRVQPDAQPS